MTEQYYRLRAAPGMDCANHSGFAPFVVRDGYVDVPHCAIDGLVRVGGCVLIGPAPAEIVVEAPSDELLVAVEAALVDKGAPAATPETVAQVIEAVAHHHAPKLTLSIPKGVTA
jgi:hypothetical protein